MQRSSQGPRRAFDGLTCKTTTKRKIYCKRYLHVMSSQGSDRL